MHCLLKPGFKNKSKPTFIYNDIIFNLITKISLLNYKTS